MGHKALAELVSLLIKRNQQNNQSQIEVEGVERIFFSFYGLFAPLLTQGLVFHSHV